MSDSPITATGPLASEPALSVGGIIAAIATVLALVSQVIPVSPATQAAILAVVASVLPLVAAYVIRSKVYAPDTVKGLVAAGIEAGGRLTMRNLKEDDGSGAHLA